MPSSGTWEESSLGQLRAAVGDEMPLFLVGTRTVLRDDGGRVLLIRRADNGLWAWPAGSIEVGESLSAGAIREAFEETGLTVTAHTPFGCQSEAGGLLPNMYGHRYHLVITHFRADAWTGCLETQTDETIDAAWFAPDDLPDPRAMSVDAVIADLAAFEVDGVFVVR